MEEKKVNELTICVVGLGYVGLPLAEAFAGKIRTIGYEIVEAKAKQIADSTKTPLIVTSDPAMIKEADMIAICVPTPVLKSKEPDLSYVKSAATTVGQNLKAGAIVVLESTVYPGATEEIVIPALEKESGMKCGQDFKVGYSPERINPGDDEHTLDKITKIISGMDEETTETLAEIYGLITTVYKAQNIKTAEAAKVIENIQRDLNIALMNELSLIFSRMDIDTKAVIDAASTKWNFHQYRPGLVGGHCIPVDPYYLVYKAKELGYHPQVILAGRAINDYMPKHVAEMAIKGIIEAGKVIKGAKVLIMGLTYKENVADTRESPVEDMIKELKEWGIEVYGYDPLLSLTSINKLGAQHFESKRMNKNNIVIDCIIFNTPHDIFQKQQIESLLTFIDDKFVLVDIPGSFKIPNNIIEGSNYKKL
ncbi:nucleotide sugar dehydrogenase [Methanoplanus limicola]|uniref:UDP-N-acetyl-D-mannosamine dehydrogenase n=1 Tax=Methanoplanus limicola DSM 2279 TaxID=937775 RepID=H1Z0C5_9EURY|nr:nucleotide sugar dehydrogenase [Methanoplanus limicola]EHQ34392.1 nucleotide sugar dehydrogenase [Methanoplanus limicola DSM 2279]